MPGLSPETIFAGRYKLIQLLGIGGYSEVWKAIDNMAGEMPVALKIFAPGKGLDSNGIKVFSSEYSLVFNLSHPGLLQAKHYDIWEGSPYLVMTYCANGSVFGKIGEMSETEVLRFIQQAADALAYLHNQPTPIIHQDIKPDNFLINDSGNYLLSDFGISSRLRRTLTRSVGNVGSAGTMAYLPPERFSQNKQILPAGDIFALGVTVYELLSGDLPFDDQGGLRLKNGADIPDLPLDFSSGLNALVRSCLNADPSLRPDAIQLKNKVSELSDSQKKGTSSQSQTSQSSQERRTVIIPKPVSSPVPQNPVKHVKKRNYLFPVLGILVGFCFIILIAINQYNKSKEEKIAEPISVTTVLTDSVPDDAAEQQRIIDSITDVIAKMKSDVPADISNNGEDQSTEESLPTKEDYTYTPQVEVPKTNTGLSIGQNYAGGIIFYIDNTGEHGLIAAPTDENRMQWGCYGKQILGTYTFYGYGQINTTRIINSCISNNAAFLCNSLKINSYDDWFLPSKDELIELFKHKNKINGLVDNYYWSSSEFNSSLAWFVDFQNGNPSKGLKDAALYVRAIRKF